MILTELFKRHKVDLVFLQETDAMFQYEAIKGNLIYFEEESINYSGIYS